MGQAIEGNNIGIYKAYIKDIDSLKNLTLSPLFSKSNKLNLGPIPGFLPILTAMEEFLITRVYIYLQVVYVRDYPTVYANVNLGVKYMGT